MATIIGMVTKSQRESQTKSLWGHMWESYSVIVKVTQSPCKDNQLYWGHSMSLWGQTKLLRMHTFVVEDTESFWRSNIVWRHTESLWVPSNHDEGNTESFWVCISYLEDTRSLWKEPRIIVKVVQVTLKARHSLWVFTSHSKRHNGSLWMSHSCFDGTSSLQRHKNYEEAESHCWGTQSRRDSHTERCEHTVIVRVWKFIVKAHRVVVKVGKSNCEGHT